MMMLTIALFAPLVGALILLVLPNDNAPRLRATATVIAAAPLALLVLAWTRFRGAAGFEQVESVRWIPTLGASFTVGIDGISLPLATMTALLFVAAIVYPIDHKGKPKAYYALFLFLETASLGVFLSLDLLLFYVFFDLSIVGMYFLIAGWGHGDAARRAALKFFLYTFLGSLAILLAILALYLGSGDGLTTARTFDMARLIALHPLDGPGVLPTLAFLGLAVGFAIKTPLVPFHTWLPPAHVDAPAPASAILAGVLLKMGTYGFVRVALAMMPRTFERFALPIAIVALLSILYGSLVALAQSNLKRRIAYTSVNHMGYVMLGVAATGGLITGQPNARALALTGATVEMVAHGLITGALFLISGSIWQRAGTYEMREFGGLARRAPILAGLTAVAVFASLGLPGLAGFVAEFQVFVGAFAVFPWLAAVGLLGIIITAALFLQLLQRVFLGDMPDRWGTWPRLGNVETTVLAVLLLLVVAIGVAPAPLLAVVNAGVQPFVTR